jgi:putative transposase
LWNSMTSVRMPRKKRMEEPGLIHHATAHGVNDELIFRDDEDRLGYRAMLAATVRRFGWLCLSFCQMGTHVHLLVETPEPNFGEGMWWLQGNYARIFNKRYRRRGHLFSDRYHDEPVLTEAHLLTVVPYIALNPVRAGLCSDPRHWPWGSHCGVAAGAARPWVAHRHLVDRLEAITGSRTAYEKLVASRLHAY